MSKQPGGIPTQTMDLPFVAVIGGLWQLDEAAKKQAIDVAKIVGAELAKAGFGLVVYFSDENSLEPHVVASYANHVVKGRGAIRVRYAESQRELVRFKEEATVKELFVPRLFPGQDWEAPFYRSVADGEGPETVDAVLLLGGGNSTLISGQIALARRLPILAIDEFGGSAAKIWNQLANLEPETPTWRALTPADHVARLKRACVTGAAKRKEDRRREQAFVSIISQRKKSVYAASAFGLLVASLVIGMALTPAPSVYPIVLFVALIAAGATGALVRVVFRGPLESDPQTSLLLGGFAGFVVGLAYLIPQFVGAPGVLEAKSATVSATDKIQFASAVLVAISAGVGFDTVFTRLEKQAQDLAVGPRR